MKKNTNISEYFFFGILWIFLFSSVGITFSYGNSNSKNYTSDQENTSLQNNQEQQFIASDAVHPFKELSYEIEEENEEEEEDIEHPIISLLKEISPLQQSIYLKYQDFLLNTPQLKRYLLFHHLKIYC